MVLGAGKKGALAGFSQIVDMCGGEGARIGIGGGGGTVVRV